jgi:hypothetical protein
MTDGDLGASDLVEDLSHGPVIMLAISNLVGFTYVDGARAGDNGPAVEITRADGHDVELTTAAEVDALVDCLQVARKEIWG